MQQRPTIPQPEPPRHNFTQQQDTCFNDHDLKESLIAQAFHSLLRSIEHPAWTPWLKWICTAVVGVVLLIVLVRFGVIGPRS